ncbi:3-oxoacyl-[acyl-carrier protein] reductase [Oscillibacter sp. PC13]|uniref:SDR family NAD(P)-dependent oxidoreductase n=1 Tax=Oscillibacter sp. PC13 TaxID=1855299 RepID=UPI0008EB4041|nr:SDR family oxidoreductase [Oscillibacter sp. PC13]SFP88283.1 3-oxoacyl-[acyl-carrier protein] reductase [Oscillibacter sp. PC13]
MEFHNVIPSDLIPDLFSIRDRVCFITGAGGLGETVARAFAHNGAKIALANRSREKADRVCEELTAEGCVCKSYALNVKSQEDCRRVTEAIEADFGHIDILIHTAAVAQLCDTLNPDDAEMKDTLETNLLGSIHINQAVSKVMVKNGFGRIININSIDAFSVNCVDGMSYACSKAALMQATKNFAVSLADKGVTVNGVAPVWIWTPMMAKRPGDYMKQAAATIPMGRVSYAEDYLGMLFFLASAASSYVTGQTFLVDGGWSVSRVFQYQSE